jgi:phenylacetate-CoA ligase
MFPFWSPQQQLERACDIVRQARKSDFYARKYAGLPDPASWEQWRQLPILERQEVYDNAFPRSRAMLTAPLEGMIISSTGGSTGVARYTCYTHQEWSAFCDVQGMALQALGIGPRDRVANLFLAGHLWPSFLGVHEAIARVGAVHLPIAGNLPLPEIARLCREFEATVMLSLPTLFLFLADLALKEGLDFPGLRLLGFGGEQMSIQAQNHIRKALGVEQILAAGYSSADCGLMGYASQSTGFATYHLPSAFQLVEILDPQGQPCGPEQEGEIFVSNLSRVSMPMLRYRLGDVGCWTALDDGDPNPGFRLAGRAGDDFKVGGGYISMAAFDETLAPFAPPFSLSYQVQIEENANKTNFHLRIEASDIAGAEARLPEVRQELLKRIPEFKQGLEMGFFGDFDIQTIELGSLPRNPITGKVKRLRDLRVVQAR